MSMYWFGIQIQDGFFALVCVLKIFFKNFFLHFFKSANIIVNDDNTITKKWLYNNCFCLLLHSKIFFLVVVYKKYWCGV